MTTHRKSQNHSSIHLFFNYQPIDNDAFDLITNILIHRSRVLLLWILNPHRGDLITSLRAFEHQIQSNFESQRRHWMTWSWPINKGRGRIDDETDVPPVNGEYKFTTDYNGDENSNPCVVYFHGVFDGSKPDIVPTSSKEAVFKIWEAFIENMEVIQGKEKNKIIGAPSNIDHDLYGELDSRKHRLKIFQSLSQGLECNNYDRILPHLDEENINVLCIDVNAKRESRLPRTITSLFMEWQVILDHYDIVPTSTPRSSHQGDNKS